MNYSDVSSMESLVIAVIERETGANNLSPDTPLDALGLDSLEFVDLLLTIGKEIKDVPQGRDLVTIADIVSSLTE